MCNGAVGYEAGTAVFEAGSVMFPARCQNIILQTEGEEEEEEEEEEEGGEGLSLSCRCPYKFCLSGLSRHA